MPDLRTLVAQLQARGDIARIARNPLAQFGTRQRRYIGAELMPERNVPENAYTEDQVRYRTVVANAGTRYSPVQKKKGVLVGSFMVNLAESDTGSELTSRDYDALRRLAIRGSLDAVRSATRWVEQTLNLPLVEWIERARWQALVDAIVQLRGDNEYSEDVTYSNPAGHRVNVAGDWDDDAYDPFDDIFGIADLLASKGYTLSRIISGRQVTSKMSKNAKVQTRVGRVKVNIAGGGPVIAAGRATLGGINGVLSDEGLPPIELYDLQYRTSTGTGYFLKRDVMVFVASSGREEALDLGDQLEVLDNVVGYVGVGVAAGQDTPGRVVQAEVKTDKPPRVEGEAWQTALPVTLEPEAVAVLKNIV